MHVVCWILQFIGHGLAEKRAPALLDNLLGGASPFMRSFIPSFRLSLLSSHANPSSLPARIDVPAVVLAPFFAHLEILFSLGYRPQLHHDIKASVGVEIARIRRLEAEKKRQKAKKAQ